MASDPQASTPPQGVTYGDPVPAGATFGQPSTPPPGVVFGQPPDDSGDDLSYWDALKKRVGSNPHEFVEGVKQRLSDLNTGAGRYFDEGMLPIEKKLRAAPVVGDALGRHGLDTQISRDQATVNAPLPTDSERRGSQQVGADITGIGEWETGSKLLEGVAASLEGMNITQKLKVLAPIEKMVKNAPKTAAILARSFSGGAVSGGQTMLHGGSMQDAIMNGVLTTLGMGTVEGAPALAAHGAEALRPPAPRTIAGANFDLLASDPKSVKGPGSAPATPLQTAAAEAGKERGVMAQRQTAAQQGMRNIAHDALTSEFNRVAKERTSTALMAPSTPRPEPQPFTIQTGETIPTREGTTGFDPRKKQIGTEYVAGKGSGTAPKAEDYNAGTFQYGDQPPLPPVSDTEPFAAPGHKEPIWQYLTSVRPGTEAPVTEGATGGGTVTFSGPEEARAALERHNDVIDSPEFDQLGLTDRKHIKAQRDSLQFQLGAYEAGLINPNEDRSSIPHFPVPDLEAAKANTHTLRDAANQIEQLHQPVFQALSDETRGRYDVLRKEEMALRKIKNNPTSVEAYNRAVERTGEIRDEYNSFFDDPQLIQKVSPMERQSAIDGWRKAQHLHDLADFVESAHNVTLPWSKRTGIERLFEPGANFQKGLEKVEEKGGPDLESLVGPEGVANIGRMANMVSTPEKQAAYKGLLGNVAGIIKRNYHGIGGLKAVGTGAGAEAVLGTLAPAAAGAAAKIVIPGFLGAAFAEGSARHIMNKLATDSEFNKRFHYAATHKVPPRISVPLLTMQLQRDLQQKEEDRKEAEPTVQDKQVVAPDAARGVKQVTLPTSSSPAGAALGAQ